MLTSPGFSSQALANEYWDVRTVADLDGDALPELIIQQEGDFHYRTNLGEGRFGVPIPLPSETSPRFVDSGDIDQDGDSDILLGGTNGVAWYENTDGKGSLSSPNWIRHRSVTRLRLEDMDSDGDIDVVAAYRVASWNRGRSIWFENIDRLGTGTFGPQRSLSTSGNSYEVVRAINLDDDPENELIVTSFQGESYGWLDGPDGEFRPLDSSVASDNPLPFGNIDGDDTVDIVDNRGPVIVYYEYDMENSIVTTTMIGDLRDLMERPHTYNEYLQGADIDNDGDLDLLVSDNEQLHWLMNQPDGFQLAEPLGNASAYSALIHDMDADGDLDFIAHVAHPTKRNLRQTSLFASDLAQRVAQTDADRDGEVSFDDYLVLAENFGREHKSGVVDGDFNGDEEVSFEDYLMLAKNYGLQLFVVPPSGGDRT